MEEVKRQIELREAVQIARSWQEQGRLAEAQMLYERILAVDPVQAEALHFLGLLRYQLGAREAGIALIRRALAADPQYAAAHSNLGNILLEQGELGGAEAAYRKALEWDAALLDARNNLGLVLRRQGRLAEAEAHYRQILAQHPDHPLILNNLGQLLAARGALEAAADCFQRAVAQAPEFSEAWKNLGQALARLQRPAEAVEAYQRAVAAGADAYLELANALRDQGLIEEAIAAYRKVLALGGRQPTAFHSLGRLLHARGREEEAAQIFQQWLDWDPENPVAAHLLAASRGKETPARASDAYVETIFDGFAQTFDQRLQELEYRAPDLLAEQVRRCYGEPAAQLRVLDAGCGTGLCAPQVRPFARTLVGVDLSAKMLAQAEKRGGYDQLIQAELTAFLEECTQAFDLILSADTLVYFGDLRPVLRAAKQALAPGGRLVFTLERSEGTGFSLQGHGRYCHGRSYLIASCAVAGLQLEDLITVVLRLEMGKPVEGWLCCVRKPLEETHG